MYIKGGISYLRQTNLEGVENNLVIVKAKLKAEKYLVVNLYQYSSQQRGVAPDT